MKPKIIRKLPAELNNELLQFAPEFLCRSVLANSNFLFYDLIQRSEKSNKWKAKLVEEREANATYTFSNVTLCPFLPRNHLHHNLAGFFVFGPFCTNLFFGTTVDDGRICVVSLRVEGEVQRLLVRNYFVVNSIKFSQKYMCEFTLMPLNSLDWDVLQIKTFVNSMNKWRKMMEKIERILLKIQHNQDPSPIPSPTPQASSSASEFGSSNSSGENKLPSIDGNPEEGN